MLQTGKRVVMTIYSNELDLIASIDPMIESVTVDFEVAGIRKPQIDDQLECYVVPVSHHSSSPFALSCPYLHYIPDRLYLPIYMYACEPAKLSVCGAVDRGTK